MKPWGAVALSTSTAIALLGCAQYQWMPRPDLHKTREQIVEDYMACTTLANTAAQPYENLVLYDWTHTSYIEGERRLLYAQCMKMRGWEFRRAPQYDKE